jgi:hypothetical protein
MKEKDRVKEKLRTEIIASVTPKLALKDTWNDADLSALIGLTGLAGEPFGYVRGDGISAQSFVDYMRVSLRDCLD